MSVHFGRGLSIVSVSPTSVSASPSGFRWPSILIQNAPPSTTIDTLLTLVRPFEPTISPDSIFTSTRGGSLCAAVHFDNEEAAGEAIKELNLVGTEINGRVLVVKPLNPAFLDPPLLDNPADDPRCCTADLQHTTNIECSWFPPTASATLHLETKAAAAKLIELSTKQRKTIRGRYVEASTYQSLLLHPIVLLVNLDPATTEEEIQKHFRCKSLLIRQPKYNMSMDDTLQYIREKFEIDSTEDLRITTEPTESRLRAVIAFKYARNAKAVFDKVKALDDQMFSKMDFTYSMKYLVHFHIPTNIWKAVKGEVNKLAHEENKMGHGDGNTNARVHIVDNGENAWADVYVHGGEQRQAAALKIEHAVKKLLNGKVICGPDGNALWDAALRGVEGKRLVQLVLESGVHVHMDYQKQWITLYGSPDKVMAAEELMKEQYTLLLNMQHELSLKGALGRMALQGGIKAVQEDLGEGTVVVDHAKHRLFVRCSPAKIRHVETLLYKPRRPIAQPLAQSPAETIGGAKRDVCPVCMEPAEQPVVELSCGHTYCKDCLQDFVKAKIDHGKFPINCFYTSKVGRTCDAPLSISVISSIVSRLDYEQLFQTAFTTYVREHPKEYSYCPTPDCPTVYKVSKVTATEPLIECSQCGVDICTACKTFGHQGQTCSQIRTKIDTETKYQEWKRAMGVKTCPKCLSDIEKNNGCNHIKCVCGAHLCWHCMKDFTSGTIYTHMSQACGGTYTDPRPVENPEPLITPPLVCPPPNAEVRARRLRERAERVERERVERERVEKEMVEREMAERERVEKERVERERAEKVERERVEKEKEEQAKRDREEAERKKLEEAKRKAEREVGCGGCQDKAQRLKEAERLSAAERERVEKERVERERVEREWRIAERARIEREWRITERARVEKEIKENAERLRLAEEERKQREMAERKRVKQAAFDKYYRTWLKGKEKNENDKNTCIVM